ncbi:hypothetical protein D3C72_1515930 [compost metagenome]
MGHRLDLHAVRHRADQPVPIADDRRHYRGRFSAGDFGVSHLLVPGFLPRSRQRAVYDRHAGNHGDWLVGVRLYSGAGRADEPQRVAMAVPVGGHSFGAVGRGGVVLPRRYSCQGQMADRRGKGQSEGDDGGGQTATGAAQWAGQPSGIATAQPVARNFHADCVDVYPGLFLSDQHPERHQYLDAADPAELQPEQQ